jgi:hypothetical protein
VNPDTRARSAKRSAIILSLLISFILYHLLVTRGSSIFSWIKEGIFLRKYSAPRFDFSGSLVADYLTLVNRIELAEQETMFG